MSLTMVAIKYCLWMCPPPLMLSTLEIRSLLQQALPSSLAGCTTFWQTQVCVCVWIFVAMSVCVCSCEQISGQACIRGYLHACLCVRASLCTYVSECVSAYISPLLHPFVYLWFMCVCVHVCMHVFVNVCSMHA